MNRSGEWVNNLTGNAQYTCNVTAKSRIIGKQ